MTTFGDQVRQYGGVPVGINRLAEIFNKDNIWFVDYDNGATAHGGQKPDDAFQIPSEAVSAAVKEGIIYIRPRSSITSSDPYYSDNITVPVTKPLVQFIGCGAGTIPGYRGSAQIRNSTTTLPIFSINAAGVVIENLHINASGATSGAAMCVNATRSASAQAVSLQMRNNRLIATAACRAVEMGSCQYSIIEDNLFLDCMRGIHMTATSGSPQSYVVRRNIFSGLKATRSVDIYVTMTDINSRGHVIADNIFTDDLPNGSGGGAIKRFIAFSLTSGSNVSTGIICGNYFADATADSLGTSGAICSMPASWLAVGNHYEGTSVSGLDAFVTKG